MPPAPLAEELAEELATELVEDAIPEPLALDVAAFEALEPPDPLEEPDVPQPTMTIAAVARRTRKLRMGISSGCCCCDGVAGLAPVYSQEGSAGEASRAASP